MLCIAATIISIATITEEKKKIKLDLKHATKDQNVSERAVVVSKEVKHKNLAGQDFVDGKRLCMKSPLTILVA